MPKQRQDEELVTTAQAAAILHRHIRSVHRLVNDGALRPAVKVPGKTGAYMFFREDVDALAAKEVA